jgi:hypothetical protein
MSKKEELELRKLKLSPEKRALLEKWKRGENKAKLPLIPKRSDLRSAILSFAQQRLWFLYQLEPGSATYNIPAAVRIEGMLPPTILTQSIGEIIRRHEALRTNFVKQDGEAFQIIHSANDWQMTTIDLQALPASERETEIQRLAVAEASKPFDLTTDSLIRATLLVLSDSEHVLLLTMHHIVSDGWSMGIFIQEIATLYLAFAQGQPSPLPELPIQYADFAVWQRQWLEEEILTKQLLYWKKQLTGFTPLVKLPASRSRPSVQSYRGASYKFGLSKELTQGLNKLSHEENATLYMTLLAAFMTLLYRYSNQEDIVVGSPIANRDRIEFEDLIGLFLNTLVLRGDLSGNPSFRELILRVREITLAAYNHKDIPLEKLVQELGLERDLSYSPLFQVWFALQNLPKTVIELLDLTLKPLEVANETVKFDLELFVYEEMESLSTCFNYNTDLFDETTISQMAHDFEILLMVTIENPDIQLKEIVEKLTEAERQRQILKAKEFQQTDRQLLNKIKRTTSPYS